MPGRRTLRYWTHAGGDRFAEDRAPVEGIPDWIVIADTGVPQFSYCPPEVRALAEQHYIVAGVFKAMDLERNLFDRQDAFFYPYAGFYNARRQSFLGRNGERGCQLRFRFGTTALREKSRQIQIDDHRRDSAQ